MYRNGSSSDFTLFVLLVVLTILSITFGYIEAYDEVQHDCTNLQELKVGDTIIDCVIRK